uniref:RNA transcription, translation and transport factor protein n=1 Tax=Rhinolophus ferrumequinum TaxID=59479 RepID=A0A671E0P4_RHIFE
MNYLQPRKPDKDAGIRFPRKLKALRYHNPAGFNYKDETKFRNCIVGLEDQKIRYYHIGHRSNLRNIYSSDWPSSLKSLSETLIVLSRFKFYKKQLTGF